MDQIIDRLNSGVKPTYGDGHELEQRRAVRERLDQLRSALTQVTPAHGGIGHNRPPPDDGSPQAVAIIEVRDVEETIRKELAKREPNALEVANATSRLQAAFGWLGKKLDKAADGFATAIGAAAAVAVVAKGTDILPPFLRLIAEVIKHVTQWLSYVTTP